MHIFNLCLSVSACLYAHNVVQVSKEARRGCRIPEDGLQTASMCFGNLTRILCKNSKRSVFDTTVTFI